MAFKAFLTIFRSFRSGFLNDFVYNFFGFLDDFVYNFYGFLDDFLWLCWQFFTAFSVQILLVSAKVWLPFLGVGGGCVCKSLP